MLNTPILFIIFNRPFETKRVFDSIRNARPKELYVAADGPRLNNINDNENSKLTREIVKNIDWDCNVKYLYREDNLGCKKAVSTAIDWFFENVEEGIIIEDDCWIAANSILLAGVTIGKGSVVAAGSVVTENVPPYSVVAGVPAKWIKSRK